MHHHTSSTDITPDLVKLCVVPSARKFPLGSVGWISYCTFARSGPRSLQQQAGGEDNGWQQPAVTQPKCYPMRWAEFIHQLAATSKGNIHILLPSLEGQNASGKRCGTFQWCLIPATSPPHTKLFWCVRYGWTGYARAQRRSSNR